MFLCLSNTLTDTERGKKKKNCSDNLNCPNCSAILSETICACYPPEVLPYILSSAFSWMDLWKD